MGVEEVCSAVNWKKIQNGWGAVNGGWASHFCSCACFSFCKEDNHAKCVIVSQMTPAWICSLTRACHPLNMWRVRCPHLGFSASRQLPVTSYLILCVLCTEIDCISWGRFLKSTFLNGFCIFQFRLNAFIQWLSMLDILNSAVQAIICHTEIQLDKMTD